MVFTVVRAARECAGLGGMREGLPFTPFGSTIMVVRFKFTPSADKHGIAHEDAIHAVTHHVGYVEVESRHRGSRAFMFVGLPHPLAMRYLEVGVAVDGRGTRTIFHVMEVGDLYRDLIPSNY